MKYRLLGGIASLLFFLTMRADVDFLNTVLGNYYFNISTLIILAIIIGLWFKGMSIAKAKDGYCFLCSIFIWPYGVYVAIKNEIYESKENR